MTRYALVMRVGVVQMTSTDDLGANLKAVRDLVAAAAERGAEFISLPESFAFLRREGSAFPCAQGFDGEIVGCLSSRARDHGVWLQDADVRDQSEGHATKELYVVEAATHGIRVNRPRVFVARPTILSISALSDVVT